MRLVLIGLIGLFSQVSYSYNCEERVTFMYLFKAQSLISQKIKDADSLKKGISFCQNELAIYKDDAKKSIAECNTSKQDIINHDSLIEEMYKDDRDSVMAEEKTFAHGVVEKFKKELDLLKLCKDYGKSSPLINSRLQAKRL